MVERVAIGDLVEHSRAGLGKVVSVSGSYVRVFFKGRRDIAPEWRVMELRLPCEFLSPVQRHADAELDNLPPWKGGKFERFPTPLTFESAKLAFAKQFVQGFADPGYVRQERAYKNSAHRRFMQSFAPQAQQWIRNGDAAALSAGLNAVYGDPKADKGGSDERLNLMYQRVEEPAYFDALRGGGDATCRFVDATLQFLETDSEKHFDDYVKSLLALPTRTDGASLEHWTTVTWLPFIARPDHHILIKPTITRTFASVLPFKIHYRSEINYPTYASCVAMAQQMRERLQHSELNLSGRPLNMLDVQSFMWVVMRYTQPALVSKAE